MVVMSYFISVKLTLVFSGKIPADKAPTMLEFTMESKKAYTMIKEATATSGKFTKINRVQNTLCDRR